MTKKDKIIHSRKYTRSQLTKIYGERDSFANLSPVDIKFNINKVKSLATALENYDDDIKDIMWDSKCSMEDLEAEMKGCEHYQDIIHGSLAILSQFDKNTPELQRSVLRSPTAPLPKFKGNEDEDFLLFLQQFENTISKFNYPDYDKFLIFKQQLEGRAAILLDSLDINSRTYAEGVKLLKSAFASTDANKHNVIKQLTELKLSSNDEPFAFISKVRKLMDSVKSLKLEADNFIQYFFWTALDENFKNQYIQITNKTKPSLRLLNENFFEACERYQTMKIKKKPIVENKNNIVSMAAKVEAKKFRECDLCAKDGVINIDHSISKCTTYSTSLEKIKALKKFDGCTKCSYLNHKTENCRFKFKNKCSCSEWHFKFLCPKENHKEATQESEKKFKTNPRAQSNVKVSIALPNAINSSCILPTLVCNIKGKNYRALRDLGSQLNFISGYLQKVCNFKTIRENVEININGFNSNKIYCTKLVEVEIEEGDLVYAIEAIVIPKINIDIKLPGISNIASKINKLGYRLADPFLLQESEEINNLDLILGTKSAYLIEAKEHTFGLNNMSTIANTKFGTILLGDIDQMKLDLPYLSRYNSHNVNLFVSNVVESDPNIDLIKSEDTICRNIVVSDISKINQLDLDKAASEILNINNSNIGETVHSNSENMSMMNKKLVDYAIDSIERAPDGRVTMGLLWNHKIKHLMGSNCELSKAILKSNIKKLHNKPEHLAMVNKVFLDQISAGIIKRVENPSEFIKNHPECSFLPHMPVFKLDRETTKCRVVFLSNLCQGDKSKPQTVSHNQAIFSGPSVNQKLSSALVHLRFDEKLLCFDLKKAFNQIYLTEEDSNKLLFWWYKDPTKGDFSLVLYKNVALPFGLRCSPCLLMLCLYQMLILDSEHDDHELSLLKKLIFQCMYMDNGALSSNSSDYLKWAYEQLGNIFGDYKFDIQQIVTNDLSLQNYVDSKSPECTTEEKVKLLGTIWNRKTDTISTRPFDLDSRANTKRLILQSVASQYDLHNFNGPLLNRARLFLHSLQCKSELGWDTELEVELLKDWKNICRQLNNSPVIELDRSFGRRDDCYNIVTFTDASKDIYACAIYLHNLRTDEYSFVMAKNRLVGKDMSGKTIPSLELLAVWLGVSYSIDLYKGVSEQECEIPLNIKDIVIYSDSLVSLSWLDSFACKHAKMQGRSVFIMNKLHAIEELCKIHSIKFEFISGTENPADCMTRSLSYRQLIKSNFVTGNLNMKTSHISRPGTYGVEIPYKLLPKTVISTCNDNVAVKEHLIDLKRFSSFDKVLHIHELVLGFCNGIRSVPENLKLKAKLFIIKREQEIYFPDILQYFANPSGTNIPDLVSKLNVYVDCEGLLRVKCKFDRITSDGQRFRFPLMLPKNSKLTTLLLQDLHVKHKHIGCYSLLNIIRSEYYVINFYSTVKKIIQDCIVCKRYNARTIKINQNSYTSERLDPPNIPFSYVYMDHAGPFMVNYQNAKKKVYLLIITCMWTRAINIEVCLDLTVKEFLRSFQLHIFSYGAPSLCISDLGSSLVAGGNIITDLLNEPNTKELFEEFGVKKLKFDQFAKGNSKLGSLVEVMVKQSKLLIYKSIKNNILEFRDFEFLIINVAHLINKRPIAFKNSLHSDSNSGLPEVITPEKLIHGRELLSIAIIPQILQDFQNAYDEKTNICSEYTKLQKTRSKLIEQYHGEFLNNLIVQATDVNNRYKPVMHRKIKPNDVVLIKEEHSKRHDYPMAAVIETIENDLGEVTSAKLRKGKTGEITWRHVDCLIPLLTVDTIQDDYGQKEIPIPDVEVSKRPKRKAAILSNKRTKNILNN